jgi:phosphohistidine swiveling domain-containing protein
MLRQLTAAWLDDVDGSLAARLVTGIGGLPSADPAFGLYGLTRQVQSSPVLTACFESIQDDHTLLAALEVGEATQDFRRALHEFLRAFGHRAVCEGEFRNPCWREDPAQVVALIRNYLQSGLTPPADVRARQERVRREAGGCVQRLSVVKRTVLEYLVERTRRSMALREQLKDLIVLRSDRARRIYAEVRARLVSRQQLSDPEDIYFLLCGEVAELLTGAMQPGAARATIARRRQDFAWSEAVRVPKLQEGVARTLRAAVSITSSSDTSGSRRVPGTPSGMRFTGTGVSPGKAEGRARVIFDPRSGSHIEPGEILVAPVTDAGWTPLFINAAGLVVDVGGLLSHGSVVAREYGLPAVVGVDRATAEIRTGDRIYLDGSAGVVVKLDAP